MFYFFGLVQNASTFHGEDTCYFLVDHFIVQSQTLF